MERRATLRTPLAATVLAAVLVPWAPAPAAIAQGETPVDLGSLGGSAGEGSTSELQIHGFGVGTYDADLASHENGFDASALALALFKPALDGRLGFFGQLTVHRDEEVTFLDPTAGPGETEVADTGDVAAEIDSLEVDWAASPEHGVDVVFGKFDSPLAVERDDAPLNVQATPSFLFDFARPVKLTGVMVRQAVSPSFEATAIVADGWGEGPDENTAKTGALYGRWSPSLRQHWGLGVIHGLEESDALARTAAVATAVLQPRERWLVGGEGVVGRQDRLAPATGSDRWTAVEAFVHHRFDGAAPGHGAWAGTLRGEVFDDPDGVRTGVPQRLASLTLSPQLLVGAGFYGIFHDLDGTTLRIPELSVRLDLRWDHSDERVFDQGGGRAGNDRLTTTLQLVYVF